MAQLQPRRASERARTRARARARTRSRYQSPALNAALERALKRERGGRSCECASLSASMNAIYERPFRSLITRVSLLPRAINRTHVYAATFRRNVNTMMERGTNDRCASERNKLIPWSRTDQVNNAVTNFFIRSLIMTLSLDTLL